MKDDTVTAQNEVEIFLLLIPKSRPLSQKKVHWETTATCPENHLHTRLILRLNLHIRPNLEGSYRHGEQAVSPWEGFGKQLCCWDSYVLWLLALLQTCYFNFCASPLKKVLHENTFAL